MVLSGIRALWSQCFPGVCLSHLDRGSSYMLEEAGHLTSSRAITSSTKTQQVLKGLHKNTPNLFLMKESGKNPKGKVMSARPSLMYLFRWLPYEGRLWEETINIFPAAESYTSAPASLTVVTVSNTVVITATTAGTYAPGTSTRTHM